MLLAGEDMDDEEGRAKGLGLGLGHVRGNSAGGSGSYRDLSYPSPSTPWDSGSRDPRSSMEALHHPSRSAPPSEASQYMTQYLMRARGSETGSMFHEGVWPPPGDGAQLVDPILRSSSEVDLAGIVDSVMGSREGSPMMERGSASTGAGVGGYGAVGGGHSRNVSGTSSAPLLIPGASHHPGTPPSPTHGRTPVRSSPLKDAMIRAGTSSAGHGSNEEENKMARTQHWIERSLAR
jgi:hypothetical protein